MCASLVSLSIGLNIYFLSVWWPTQNGSSCSTIWEWVSAVAKTCSDVQVQGLSQCKHYLLNQIYRLLCTILQNQPNFIKLLRMRGRNSPDHLMLQALSDILWKPSALPPAHCELLACATERSPAVPSALAPSPLTRLTPFRAQLCTNYMMDQECHQDFLAL